MKLRGDGFALVSGAHITGNLTMFGDGYLQVSAFGIDTTVDGNVVSYSDSWETFVGAGFGTTVMVGGHVMAKGDGGGVFLDNWAGSVATATIGKSTCGVTDATVYTTSSVGGKISDNCSPRN